MSDAFVQLSRRLAAIGKDVATLNRLVKVAPLSAGAAKELTIVAGAVEATRPFMRLLPETGTADDLTNISNFADGKIVVISAQNNTDAITLVSHEGAPGGNIDLKTASYKLVDSHDALMLIYNGSTGHWEQLGGSASSVTFEALMAQGVARLADKPPATPHASNDEFNDSALAAAWTQVAPGGTVTATYSEAADGKLHVAVPARAGWGADAIVRAAPAGDFTMTTCITGLSGLRYNWQLPAVMLLMQGDHTLPVHIFGLLTAYPAYSIIRGSDLATWAATLAEINTEFTLPIYLKFERVGTTWNFYTSGTGHSWTRVHTMAEAWTIANIGIGGSPEHASYAVGASFDWVRFNWAIGD